MKSDLELQRYVLDELEWEPSVRANDIGVAVHDGVVTLTGRIDSFTEKEHAEHACKRVMGVRAVANDLEVVLPTLAQRDDTDIAMAAARVLEWNTLVPRDAITPTVRGGWITLEGEVDWKYQRDVAYRAVVGLSGVRGVLNSIRVTPRVEAKGIRTKIEAALTRSAHLDADRIQVETVGNRVTLRGAVRTWAEREDAERAAWSAPGVGEVDSYLRIEVPELALM